MKPRGNLYLAHRQLPGSCTGSPGPDIAQDIHELLENKDVPAGAIDVLPRS